MLTTDGGSAVCALRQLSAERVSGVLTVTGEPGGTIFLVDGVVQAVESPAAPSVGDLLIGRGQVTVRQWEDALRVDGAPAEALVDAGLLTAGDLELCALEALYDAAYFTLVTEPADIRFDAGATARVRVGGVDAAELCDGLDRQRRLLDEAYDSDGNDRAPVRPVRRPGFDRVLLSGLQWEILLHADGRRSPTELARLLGRPAFAVRLDVRRLVAAGLVHRVSSGGSIPVAPPRAGAERAPGGLRPDFPTDLRRGTSVDVPRGGATPAPATPAPAPAPAAPAPAPAAPAPAAPVASATIEHPVLPRRVPGDTLTTTVGAGSGRASTTAGALAQVPGMTGRPADDSMLRRIRAALHALR